MATRQKPAKATSKTARVEVIREKKSEAKAASSSKPNGTMEPAKGKLGVMIPGMGAVATTFVAGVEAIRKGLAKPIGSLTQWAPSDSASAPTAAHLRLRSSFR